MLGWGAAACFGFWGASPPPDMVSSLSLLILFSFDSVVPNCCIFFGLDAASAGAFGAAGACSVVLAGTCDGALTVLSLVLPPKVGGAAAVLKATSPNSRAPRQDRILRTEGLVPYTYGLPARKLQRVQDPATSESPQTTGAFGQNPMPSAPPAHPSFPAAYGCGLQLQVLVPVQHPLLVCALRLALLPAFARVWEVVGPLRQAKLLPPGTQVQKPLEVEA